MEGTITHQGRIIKGPVFINKICVTCQVENLKKPKCWYWLFLFSFLQQVMWPQFTFITSYFSYPFYLFRYLYLISLQNSIAKYGQYYSCVLNSLLQHFIRLLGIVCQSKKQTDIKNKTQTQTKQKKKNLISQLKCYSSQKWNQVRRIVFHLPRMDIRIYITRTENNLT